MRVGLLAELQNFMSAAEIQLIAVIFLLSRSEYFSSTGCKQDFIPFTQGLTYDSGECHTDGEAAVFTSRFITTH